jgi:hypothetical protein
MINCRQAGVTKYGHPDHYFLMAMLWGAIHKLVHLAWIRLALYPGYRESTRTEEGAVAGSTCVGGRAPPPTLNGRIHGVLSGE